MATISPCKPLISAYWPSVQPRDLQDAKIISGRVSFDELLKRHGQGKLAQAGFYCHLLRQPEFLPLPLGSIVPLYRNTREFQGNDVHHPK